MFGLKTKIRNRESVIGSWISIGHPAVVEIMADCGFDFLVVDLEHTTISIETLQILINQGQGNRIPMIVRVPSNDSVIIKRVLDAGADGIIVPMVNTQEDAKYMVESCYYPPIGKRGLGLYRAQKYGFGLNEYFDKLKNEVILIAQIEDKLAVNNIASINQTEEIDGFLIGPYDLSSSLGYPGEFDHPLVLEALEKVELECKKANNPVGFHVISSKSEEIAKFQSRGHTMLIYSADFIFLGEKIKSEMSQLKR